MSSQTDYRRVCEPQSTTFDSYSTEYLAFPNRPECVIYDDANLANIEVQPVEMETNSIQNGGERYEQYNSHSMLSEQCRSMYQPTGDTGSIDYGSYSNPILQSYEEQLRLESIQKQGTMESYRRKVVVPSSGKMLQQPHESLPNTSLQGEPPGSLPNISVENNGSLASQYPSYNHHANQSSSHSQSHKVVFHNRSCMLGQVNQSGDYQHQSGQPNVDVGANQYASQEQGAKVILPNRSAMLGEVNRSNYQNQTGRSNDSIRVNQNASQYYSNKVVLPNRSAVLGEANHSIYQNQTGRPNDNIGINQNASQYYPGKVVLPNHSAVLPERNPNLPLVGHFSLTRNRPVSSGDQTASSSQNISLPGTGTEAQPVSVMSQRNRKLDMQNPQNITIPPTLIQDEPGSNCSIYKDQKGEVHSQDQYHPSTVAPPPDVSQYQIHPQSQNYAHVESNPVQHHSPGDYTGKKVFILHFSETGSENPVLQLGLALRRMKVDVTLDLFEYDSPPNSWPLWSEQKINESDVVLCIITKNFYHQLTNSNHVLGYSVYNLMNSSKNITFRAVFIDANKEMEYVPPAMRGATCYSIYSNRLTPNDDNFADLYAFLTGQNRITKPPLGNMITLAPKRSRCKSTTFTVVYYVTLFFLF